MLHIASVDVERHARDFMEAAKKLQLYFISLQREDHPTKTEMLQKVMECILEFGSIYTSCRPADIKQLIRGLMIIFHVVSGYFYYGRRAEGQNRTY